MKKVFSALVLTSLLAVLLVPVMASAVDNCKNWNCQGKVGTVPCMCGDDTRITDSSYYCWGGGNNGAGRAFSAQSACDAAMSGGTTGGTEGYQEIPENVPSTPAELVALIETIGNWIFTILLGVVVIILILAGFFWVTAGGNSENVKKASDMLRNALIGIAIALGAKGLVAVIKGFILK